MLLDEVKLRAALDCEDLRHGVIRCSRYLTLLVNAMRVFRRISRTATRLNERIAEEFNRTG